MNIDFDDNYYYTVNGIIIHSISEIPQNAIVQKNPRLLGGKGGFGSMLRAIGSQIEKTTNREMCRDLNGRRMRDVNNEKRLKEWLDKADDREREKLEKYLEKRRKRKVLLEQGPSVKIAFEDKTAEEQRRQIANELQEAINDALERRRQEDEGGVKKKIVKPKKINVNIDSDLESSSSSSSSNSSDRSDEENDCAGLGELETGEEKEEPRCKKVKEEEKKETDEEEDEKKEMEEGSKREEEEKEEGKLDEKNILEEGKLEEASGSVPKEEKTKPVFVEIDLDQVGSVTHLLTFGMDWIRNELERRGLKCGGTLMERATRLYSVKGLERYPEHLLIGHGGCHGKGGRKRKAKDLCDNK